MKTPSVLENKQANKASRKAYAMFLYVAVGSLLIFAKLRLLPSFIESPGLFSSQIFPTNNFTVY